MDTMRAVVLATCVISLLTGLLDSLKPSAKFDRQMRLLLSAVFLIGILTPLCKGAVALEPQWNEEISVSDAVSVAVDTEVIEQTIQNTEKLLETYLQENGVTDGNVLVEMHMTQDSRIEIEHVTVYCADTETAKEVLKAYLGEEVNLDVEKTA